MLPSLTSNTTEQPESLNVSNHTFSSDLSCKDWDLSDHSDSSEELHDSRSSFKSVTFGKVRVRSYPTILGDNPSCSKGLPVTLDWKSVGPTEEYDLDFSENDDLPRKPVTRLSSKSRRAILFRMGVSPNAASKISREIDEIKKSRSLSSMDHMPFMKATKKEQQKRKEGERTAKSKQEQQNLSATQINMDEYIRMISLRRKKGCVNLNPQLL